MQMVKIKCTKCNSEGSISLTDPSYNGPFRCWKCRAVYMIKLTNNQLISCEPMTELEFEERYPKKRPGGY